jgi:hypothetical protein
MESLRAHTFRERRVVDRAVLQLDLVLLDLACLNHTKRCLQLGTVPCDLSLEGLICSEIFHFKELIHLDKSRIKVISVLNPVFLACAFY